MGAPKKKWTSEEESALKAGIAKHGLGRWTTIIKDPQFSAILLLRSNIDLKDKWRNMCVGTSGFGSRERVKAAFKGTDKDVKLDDKPPGLFEKGDNDENPPLIVEHDEKVQDLAAVQQKDEDVIDVKPLSDSVQISNGSKKTISRMENVVLEAIISLKEPRGSNKTNISTYIEDQYDAPLEFQRILSEKLKALTASGKILKVNGKYRIAPPNPNTHANPNPNPNASRIEGAVFEEKQRTSFKAEKVEMRTLTESQVVEELAKIRTMSAKEAAEAAARAVAEAEAALAVAEQAAKEAEAAEADAEAAEAFAEAALMTLKNRNRPGMVWCG
ncbi:hypothetical protein ACHQM5_024867 [Ranunculus cassubicifolius]